jgi:hypothetical protein
MGQLFVLGQCSCGDDWTQKFSQVDFKRLSKWIRPLTSCKAIRAFTLPRHIPNNPFFFDVNHQAGFTLDRARLTLVADEFGENLANHPEIKKWALEIIEKIVVGFTQKWATDQSK